MINIDPVSAIAYYKKKKRHDKVISSLIGAREIDPELAEILKVEINKVLAALTPREEKVLRIYFGIGEKTDHTLEEIAQDFDVTPERIRQIKAKALKKLRRWHSRKE